MEHQRDLGSHLEICEFLENENDFLGRFPMELINEWMSDLDREEGFDVMMNELINSIKDLSEKLKQANEEEEKEMEELEQNYKDLEEIRNNLELFHQNFQLIKQMKEHVEEVKYMDHFIKNYDFRDNSKNGEYHRICNFLKKMKEMKICLLDELYKMNENTGP